MARRTSGLDEVDYKILEALKELNKPSTCKEIGEKIGVDARRIAAKMRKLKRLGLVESPEQGKYMITEEGLKTLESPPS